ncbi:MAG: hypothetical protein ACI9IA_000828 [Enterobacterales bacterium]|jgi:hypothetical protein
MHYILICLLFLFNSELLASKASNSIMPMKQRAETINTLLDTRFKTITAQLMRRENIKMWVLVAREYNEDPVVMTMLPGTSHAARRRTILVLVDEGEAGVKGYAVSKYGVGDFFKAVWDEEKQPNQWKALADLITKKNPQTIGLNISATFPLADGLTQGEYLGLIKNLTEAQKSKIVSAESLSVSWLETRTKEEMQLYPSIVAIAHQIIREGFSSNVIKAGITTTEDVMWWYRDRIRELRLQTWFHPSVSIQRADSAEKEFIDQFQDTERDGIIQLGDLLHVDFGISYLRLNTDTQQHAYMLKAGEKDAPEGLKAALKKGNQLQDILMSNFKIGRTGNEILKMSRQMAIDKGLKPTIYTHPIGYQGHGAGPTIGMWDNQGDTIGRGDYPMHENTAYSIELNVKVSIPEWANKEIRIMLEEDAFFDGKETRFMVPRQTDFILIAQ